MIKDCKDDIYRLFNTTVMLSWWAACCRLNSYKNWLMCVTLNTKTRCNNITYLISLLRILQKKYCNINPDLFHLRYYSLVTEIKHQVQMHLKLPWGIKPKCCRLYRLNHAADNLYMYVCTKPHISHGITKEQACTKWSLYKVNME